MERVDIIILGATGFTGRFAVKFLAKITKQPEYCDISWGISGRSMEKLQNLLKELKEMDVDTSKILLIECNITDSDSMINMAKQGKVLVNCTGPFTVLGEHVIKSCILTGTHYVDISAEIYQILVSYKQFNKMAEEANVLIIPACGWASAPVSMGLMFLEKHFKGTLNTVECYIKFEIPACKFSYLFKEHCLICYGTWESLVHVLINLKQYIKLKKKTFPEELRSEKIQRSFIHRKNERFWFPYPGPDNDVVEMSQRYLQENKRKTPIHFVSYTTMPYWYNYIVIPILYLYYFLCRFKFFQRQMWKHPKFYTLGYMSRVGPTDETIKTIKYDLTLYGTGWDESVEDYTSVPNKYMSVKVSGTDPGYQTTVVTLILSALTLIIERSKMPSGGVVMPGAAYQNTSIIEKLINNGMKFEIFE